MTALIEWIREYDRVLAGLGALSIVTFLSCILLAPLLAGLVPVDYFMVDHSTSTARHPVAHVLLLLLRALVGGVVILAGIAMLFFPGQGLLTILLGLSISNFPGKQAFELWLVRLPHVLDSLNWLRSKSSRPPLHLPPHARRPQ